MLRAFKLIHLQYQAKVFKSVVPRLDGFNTWANLARLLKVIVTFLVRGY